MVKDVVDKVTGEINWGPLSRPQVRQVYDDHMPMSTASGLLCQDESLASQSAKDEADINVLVRRFGLDGIMPQDVRAPTYGDFTGLGSYQEALNALLAAQQSFMSLPAHVRSEFDNDPHRFVSFCSDDANYDRMLDMGLAAPEAMEKRVKARQKAAADALEASVQAEISRREKAGKPA